MYTCMYVCTSLNLKCISLLLFSVKKFFENHFSQINISSIKKKKKKSQSPYKGSVQSDPCISPTDLYHCSAQTIGSNQAESHTIPVASLLRVLSLPRKLVPSHDPSRQTPRNLLLTPRGFNTHCNDRVYPML